jgi:hypothetical protein
VAIDVDAFVERGCVRLPGAVPRGVAQQVRIAAQGLVGDGDPGEPWRLGQASVYDLPALVDAATPAVRAAFDALAGDDQWHLAANWGFPTRFPRDCDTLWHIDGDWFTHHVTSAEQVLTPIFLWDDVDVDDSPTLLGVGSHLAVARLLADTEPEAISGERIGRVVHDNVTCDDVEQATGAAGDVIICHPFLAHTINPAGPMRPRRISNVAVHGRAPLRHTTTSAHHLTPVELAIRNALGAGRS